MIANRVGMKASELEYILDAIYSMYRLELQSSFIVEEEFVAGDRYRLNKKKIFTNSLN